MMFQPPAGVIPGDTPGKNAEEKTHGNRQVTASIFFGGILTGSSCQNGLLSC